jgi:hypothetical protein
MGAPQRHVQVCHCCGGLRGLGWRRVRCIVRGIIVGGASGVGNFLDWEMELHLELYISSR